MEAMDTKQAKMCMRALHVFYHGWDHTTRQEGNEMLDNECTAFEEDDIRSLLDHSDGRQELMEGAKRVLSKARIVRAGSVPSKIDTALHQGPRSPPSSGSTPSSLHGGRKSHKRPIHISPSSMSGQSKDFASPTNSLMSPALFQANEQRRKYHQNQRSKSFERSVDSAGDSPMSSSMKNHKRRMSADNHRMNKSFERNERRGSFKVEFMEHGPEYKQAPTDTSRPSVKTTKGGMIDKGWGIAVEDQASKVTEHDMARSRRNSFRL
jgi:hypothetical protein